MRSRSSPTLWSRETAKATDGFEMAFVPAAFRREFDNTTRLIQAGDAHRCSTVGHHVAFMVEALHHHHAAEDEVI